MNFGNDTLGQFITFLRSDSRKTAQVNLNERTVSKASIPPTEQDSEDTPLPVPLIKEEISILPLARFPSKAYFEHMFVERVYVFYEADDKSSLSEMMLEVFQQKWQSQMIPNSHIMLEIRTMDNRVALTKFCPYEQHGADMVGDDTNEEFRGTYELERIFLLTIYSVDLLPNVSIARAFNRLNFLRKSVEEHKFAQYAYWEQISTSTLELLQVSLQMVQLRQLRHLSQELLYEICKIRAGHVKLDECTKPFESLCDCDKLHLRDYCTFKMITLFVFDGIIDCQWLVQPSELCRILNSTSINAADILAMIVNRLIRNTFANVFDVNTTISYDIITGGQIYLSRYYHHSELELPAISKEISYFRADQTMMLQEFAVTFHVKDKLQFGTFEKICEAFDNRIILPQKTQKKAQQNTTSNGTNNKKDVLTLRSKFFRKDSNLWKKAVIFPVPVKDAYKILSSKIKINTTKGRITEFLVEPNRLFCDKIVDNSLLLAYICLNIVKTNEIAFWTKKSKKIILKLFYERTLVQAVLNENDCWNPNNLKEDMFRERSVNITGQFQLEVLYRSR